VSTSGIRAKVTLPSGREVRAISHLRTTQSSFVQVKGAAIDAFAVNEIVARSYRHRVGVVRVCVVEVAAAVPVTVPAVAEDGITEIDVAILRAAGAVPRTKRLVRTEREPADAESKAAAEETNKGRTIDRTSVIRTRAPTPA